MAGLTDRLRKAAAAPKRSNGNSNNPTLPGSEVLVDEVVEMKKKLEDMNREYEFLEEELFGAAMPLYDEARLNGTYATGVYVPGKTTNGAVVLWSDRYSAFPVEMEKELRKKDPNFGKHFVEVRKLTVKRDAGKTISDKTIEKLIAALGEDFEKIFDVKVEIGAAKGFAEQWGEVPESIRDLMKQSKPAVRNCTADGKVI